MYCERIVICECIVSVSPLTTIVWYAVPTYHLRPVSWWVNHTPLALRCTRNCLLGSVNCVGDLVTNTIFCFNFF